MDNINKNEKFCVLLIIVIIILFILNFGLFIFLVIWLINLMGNK